MDTNKILSANILDLIFDDRNKEYGAYELRKTYAKRIAKALLITAAIALIVFTGAVLASSLKPDEPGRLLSTEVTLIEIPEDKPEPLPEPERPEPQPQVQTQRLTEFRVVPNDEVDIPPPEQEDFKNSEISNFTQEGIPDDGLVDIKTIDRNAIIEPQKEVEPEIIYHVVEIPAKCGNWQKFLIRNLNADIPVENGAPAGRYTVIMQFVVDTVGNVNDIKALTSLGFGMEDEAMRVLKKAIGWQPGIQNGRKVKSYHKQPITFEVNE